MKLFLFGGAETSLGQVEPLLKLIEQVIRESGAKQVLHIPFARTTASEPEWNGDWYHRHIHLPEVEYLNASHEGDLQEADGSLVFMSGGGNNQNLLEKIAAQPRLFKLIQNAQILIGESAGAKVLGEYLRLKWGDEQSKIVKGLNIIPDTVIEPHYTERNRQSLLAEVMRETEVKYGLGIDCVTAIEFELDEFPIKYKKIGSGSVEIKTSI